MRSRFKSKKTFLILLTFALPLSVLFWGLQLFSDLSGTGTPKVYAAGPVYTVTTASDSGGGSLRDIILQVNADNSTTPVTITFDGDYVITLLSSLDSLSRHEGPTTILGDRGTGKPRVVINGENLGSEQSALRISSSSENWRIQGLAVVSTTGAYGISIWGDANEVVSSYLGLNVDGVSPAPNGGGVKLDSSAENNVIEGNWIAGNVLFGIDCYGTGNEIRNNDAGLNVNGDVVPNGINGVLLRSGAENNLVEGNRISGNDADGLYIEGNYNEVRNNYIGLDATGTLTRANDGTGILLLQNAHDNIVDGNWIGGNANHGISLYGDAGGGIITPTHHNTITHNYIGTNAAFDDLGNGNKGIMLHRGSHDNYIFDNVIAYSKSAIGIYLLGDEMPPTGNRIISNTVTLHSGDEEAGGAIVSDRTHTAVSNTVPSLSGGFDNVIASNLITGNAVLGIANIGASPLVSGNLIFNNTYSQTNSRGGIYNLTHFGTLNETDHPEDDILSIPYIVNNVVEGNDGVGIKSIDTAPVMRYDLLTTLNNAVTTPADVDKVSQLWYAGVEVIAGTVTETVPVTNANVRIWNEALSRYYKLIYYDEVSGSAFWFNDVGDMYEDATTWQEVKEFSIGSDDVLDRYLTHTVQVKTGAVTGTILYAFDGLSSTKPLSDYAGSLPNYQVTAPYARYQIAEVNFIYDQDDDGVPDIIEIGDDPLNPVDGDGDGTPDYQDPDNDSDGDGIPDGDEIGDDPLNPVDTDGDGTPDFQDDDSDNDGIPDSEEAGDDPLNPTDTDGDGIPDYQDDDSDNDGIPDSEEAGDDPLNPTDTDGDGIPDYQDDDSDNDGIPDNEEAGDDPLNPTDTDGDGIPDYQDDDSDGDGILDSEEAGDDPLDPTDTDGDGIPDYQDDDSDGDGILDSEEAGDDPLNPTDTDGDGIPDYQDDDSDNDGILDSEEAGDDPLDPTDTDGDGTPDYQDDDSDGDGIPDSEEAGDDPLDPTDTDGDGILDYQDDDSDGDGIPDSVEAGDDPLNPVDTDSDGIPDYQDEDSDGDGVNDEYEAGDDPTTPQDSDGDNVPDYQDDDDDGDGIATVDENPDPNGDHNPDDALDSDEDGVPDYLDPDYGGFIYLPLVLQSVTSSH